MNNFNAFFELLVASSGDYNKSKVAELAWLDAVYLDVKPEVARNGQQIKVFFPDLGPVTDQGAGAWVPEDISPNYVTLTFNQRPGKAIKSEDFLQWQTAVEVIDQFLDPMFNRILEYFSGQIAGLVNTTNFNTYSAIQCLTPTYIGQAEAGRAWGALAKNKVPVSQKDKLFLLKHPDVHAQMISNLNWTQESLVGLTAAQQARQEADLAMTFRFQQRWDQQAPITTITLNGTVTATNGSATVVGSGTTFTSQLAVYDNLVFAGDPTATPYRVLTITDDTHVVLTGVYTGYTTAAAAVTKNSYTAIALHKYAMALAVRPLELVNNGQTHSRLVKLRGIPIRVQISYEHMLSAYVLTMDAGCAMGVLRPDFGVIIKV